MAVVVNSASDVIGRTTSLPSATAFTVCGWSRILGDVGNIQPIVTLVNGSTTGMTLVWRTGASSDMEIWALSSGGVSNSGTFSSRPATNADFFWYVRCSGTGAGQLQAGWLAAGGDTFVTASAQMLANTPTQFTVGTAIATYNNNSRFAAVKVWDAALTDAELFTEAQFQVAIRRSNQRYEWPLLDSTDSRDLSGNGFAPTLTSVDTADGPPAAWAPRPQVLVFVPAAAGGGGAESGAITAGSTFGASFAAVAAAQGALNAGFSAGFSDTGAAAAVASFSGAATAQAQLSALAAAVAAIQAGVSAGEAWAAQAAALAGLSAGTSFGAAFDGDTDSSDVGALTAGTEAAAEFLGAAAALALLQAGASVDTAVAAQSAVVGAFAASVSADAAFIGDTANDAVLSAAASVAAAFSAVTASLDSVSAASSLSAVFSSIATALAAITENVELEALFIASASNDARPDVRDVVRVAKQVRAVRVGAPARAVRVN